MEGFFEEYSELEDYVQCFDNSDFTLSINGKNQVSITIPHCEKNLILKKRSLLQIEGCRLVTGIKGLSFLGDRGFTFNNYAEFFVDINHPKYALLDFESAWPTAKPLQFKIDEATISLGLASPLIVFLMELPFCDSNFFHYGFAPLATLKIFNNNTQESKNMFHKALFYLNSHYLKTLNLYATLKNVSVQFEDPLKIYNGTFDPPKEFQKITRTRKWKRTDFSNCEPLILYNHACASESEEKFIALYRILEFHFNRNRLKVLKNLRYKENISEAKLLKSIDLKDELKQLKSLLKEITTPALKKRILKYAKSNALITKENFDHLAQKLYDYRNAIVHAKETKLDKVRLPDPFSQNPKTGKWISIARELAERAIVKLNT